MPKSHPRNQVAGALTQRLPRLLAGVHPEEGGGALVPRGQGTPAPEMLTEQ